MQMIKGFLFVITGLFIMVTLVSLLIPSRVIVTRGVVVNAAGAEIYGEISNLRRWTDWQPALRSVASQLRFSADSNKAGSTCHWESSGKENAINLTSVGNNRITFTLSRKGEHDVDNVISILPLADSNSVQVEWQALTRLKWYPWDKFYGIFIEKLTGPGYEESLNSLKQFAEKH